MNILMDNDLNVNIAWDTNTAMRVMVGGDSYVGMGYSGSIEDSSAESKPSGASPLSSWPFVIGITGAVFLVSMVIGILLAKKRIKKGIDLYEN